MWGLHAAAHRLPFLPIRAGLGSDVMRVNPELRTVSSPYADGEELVAVPALRLDAALVHLNRADRAGQRPVPGPGPVLRRPVLRGGGRRVRLLRAASSTRAELTKAAPPQTLLVKRHIGDRGRRDPERRALHLLRPRLRPGRGLPEARTRPPPLAREFAERFLAGGRARRTRPPSRTWREGGRSDRDVTRRPGPSTAWSPAPRPGAATARSWPARWA